MEEQEVFISCKRIGFSKYSVSNTGYLKNNRTGRVTLGTQLPGGRFRVTLTSDKHVSHHILINILILLVFVGERPTPSHTSDHIDQNPSNNNLYNLRWATPSEQALNKAKRETHKASKPIVQIDDDGNEIMSWFKTKDAANFFGISKTNFPAAIRIGYKLGGYYWKYSENNIDGEIWKKIICDDYEENISVSNKGRYLREDTNKKGFGVTNVQGYKSIGVKRKSGGFAAIRLNRLVLWGFLGNDPTKIVNHKDGRKNNNNFENLEYVTSQENTIHAIKTGLRVYTTNGKQSRSIKQMDLNGNLIKIWKSAADVKRELNISRGNISSVCLGDRNQAGGFRWAFVNNF